MNVEFITGDRDSGLLSKLFSSSKKKQDEDLEMATFNYQSQLLMS